MKDTRHIFIGFSDDQKSSQADLSLIHKIYVVIKTFVATKDFFQEKDVIIIALSITFPFNRPHGKLTFHQTVILSTDLLFTYFSLICSNGSLIYACRTEH